MFDITKQLGWDDAAKKMIAAGFSMERREGVIPAIFRRGQEVCYLFSPILDGYYTHEQHPEWGVRFVKNRRRPIILMPVTPSKSLRVWIPRPWNTRPPEDGYTIRDVAEHVGRSIATLKKALYDREGDGPRLVPDGRKGKQNKVLLSEAQILEWIKSSPDYQRRASDVEVVYPDPRKRSDKLYLGIAQKLQEQKLSPNIFAEKLSKVTGEDVGDLLLSAQANPDLFAGKLKQHLTRDEVIELLVQA